jgi:C4-dicarboxylate-specific signal transduction histidine kinase
MDTVPGFVALIDSTGLVYMANHATLSLYPYIVGSKLGKIDHTSDWEQFIIEFLYSGRTSAVTEQKTFITGTLIHTLLNVKKMDDGGVIVVSIITTDLMDARAKLRDQEAHTQYTAKLASLGEMAAGIAHEVNNPLTIILGSANIMKKIVSVEPIDKEMLTQLADKMVETTGRISKTVKSLKALSRNAENDPMTTVSIGKVLELSLDLCQQNFKNHAIIFKKSEGLHDIMVTGREVQLYQVVVNLLNNAGDAVKNEADRWVEFRADTNNGYVDIYVSDSGKGIPFDIRHRIMEPFFTTKDVNQGTGLGLSISKKIIEEHGGELKLLPDAGFTTFHVRLKMAQPA